MNKSLCVIIQARWNSSRLPGKVLKKIKNKSLLEILTQRLKKSKKIKDIIVATSKNKKDKLIIDECKKLKIKYFTGSEHNVLSRYYSAAKKFKIDNIVRVTSDCPLIDPSILDEMIDKFEKGNYDYVSNINPPTFPDGMDLEIFNFSSLKKTFLNAKSNHDTEHVTPYILKNSKFKKFNFIYKENLSNIRLTVDEEIDFKLIEKIIKKYRNFNFTFKNIVKLYKRNKKFFHINLHLKRNEGTHMNIGEKYWRRAQKIIPGGSMLFSKNPDLYLPKLWPAYFKKAKGINIWGLDGKKYLDMNLMGVGTNILGYARKEIDSYVKKHIDFSNVSSLNNIFEIELAEKLVSMHSWSHMARFARTGGEANLIALRAARLCTNKSKIAICGYHGWHDWYLSANLSNKRNLDNFLIKNLSSDGIPLEFKDTAIPFQYNNINSLKKILNNNSIAAVFMEVQRDIKPNKNFLKQVRNLCNKKKVVLIFDECTSGFRETFGGLHLKYNIMPDIVILGKALGNGYAINCVLGKRSVMESLSKSFVSSTFWTEKVGTMAALKTLEVMEKERSWEKISKIGKKIKINWKKLANKNNIKIFGLDALPKFQFVNRNNLLLKTFITQEFLKKNFLGSNVIYLSTKHDNNKLLKRYYDCLNNTFRIISKYNDDEIRNFLLTHECISGIRND